MQILITDKDYQEAINNNRTNGVLAKIHGDIDDYNSLALTLQGVAATCDQSLYVGDDIDPKRAKQQFQWVFPRTTLSIPKALFLQRVLQDRKIVVMGYSGSDSFDIMPILTASMFGCRGLWVEYGSGPLSQEVERWRSNGKDRVVLQPESRGEDLPSKISKYFLDIFGGSWQEEAVNNNYTKSLSERFKSWIERLRLHPGDGLCCLANLYSQRGKWTRAKVFYTKAIEKYEKDLDHNELRWLMTKSNLGYVLDNLNEKNNALNVFREVKEYIEKNEKQKLYPSLYANTLLTIARCDNRSENILDDEMVDKAMDIAQWIGGMERKKILYHRLRLAADRYLSKKNYKKALDFYLRVIQLSGDVFGDIRETCLSSMNAGICLAKMGNQYGAIQMLLLAKTYAKYLGDEKLINAVKYNYSFITTQFVGMSPSLNFHKELWEAAKNQADDLDKKKLDELMEYIGFEQYDPCLKWIDKLLSKYDHPDMRAFLLFLKSNIYHRMQMPNKEIELLKEL